MKVVNTVVTLIMLVSLSCNFRSPRIVSPESVQVRIKELRSKLDDKTKNDPEFKSASDFILDNIGFHYFLDGNKTDEYLNVINSFKTDEPRMIKAIIDSVKKLNLRNATMNYDAVVINNQFLIDNIEQSLKYFNKWSWSKNVSKDIFNNYVLPYSAADEKISNENWREYFRRLFLRDRDSSFFTLSREQAAAEIQLWLYNRKKTFKIFPATLLDLPPLPVIDLDGILVGTCNELTIVGASAMRSFGIPVSIDFTPNYLNVNAGHEWNCIITGPNSFIPFDVTTNLLFKHKLPSDKLAKVYRRTYEYNRESHYSRRGNSPFVPTYFNSPFIKDVTSSYIDTKNISVSLNKSVQRKSNFAYLSLFRLASWIPVGWGEVSGNNAYFKAVGKGGVYLTQFIEPSRTTSGGSAFILEKNGSVRYLNPDLSSLQTVKLGRKFPMNERKETFLDKLIGGVFQGSDDSTFSHPVELYKIEANPGEHFKEILLGSLTQYRYVRYLAPQDGYGNIAELKFYENKTDNDTVYLKGRVLGSAGSIDPFTTITAAADNNVLTFFCSNNPDTAWVGFDFGEMKKIEKIRYLARNDMNSIQKGNEYELFYWNDSWVSVERKFAEQDGDITFKGVPENALLWLRCISKGQEERIFTYENGKQIWW